MLDIPNPVYFIESRSGNASNAMGNLPSNQPSCSIEMTEEIQQPGSLDSTIWKTLDLQTPPALPSTSTSMPELQSNLRESNGTSRLGTQDLERFHQSGNPKRTLFAATVDTRALPREMINSTLLSRSTEIEKVDVGLTENSALRKDHCHLLIKTKKQIRLSTLQSQLADIPGLIYLKCLSPIPEKGIYTLQQAVEAYRKYMMKSWNGRKPGGKTATNLAHQMKNKQSTTRKIQAAIKTGGLQNRFKNLLNPYPTCRMIIKQNLDLRPPRRHKTHCLYIHGPTGIGKTRMTHAYLRLE